MTTLKVYRVADLAGFPKDLTTEHIENTEVFLYFTLSCMARAF
jgi:hypothetical protein